MSESLYKQGLDFCLENEVLPIFLGDEPIKLDKDKKYFLKLIILDRLQCLQEV